MQWLQDKKNLPIVIALVAVIVVAAGVFLYMQLSGGGKEDEMAAAPMGSPTQTPASPDGTADPTASPGGETAPPQAPSAPSAVEGTTGAPMASSPGAGGLDEEAGPPGKPGERWRVDPFADSATERKDKPVTPLRFPIPGRLFPPERKAPAAIEQITPQPPRRVAGILHGDKVNALIQTPDGWEVKRPGEKLSDGTIVERIERDRVILRTVSGKPEYVEVRLAASLSQIESSAMPGSGNMPVGVIQRGGGVRGLNPPGM